MKSNKPKARMVTKHKPVARKAVPPVARNKSERIVLWAGLANLGAAVLRAIEALWHFKGLL